MSRPGAPAHTKGTDAYYRALRRKGAERSRKRRKLTGEAPPGQGAWHCARCRQDVKVGDACAGCGRRP